MVLVESRTTGTLVTTVTEVAGAVLTTTAGTTDTLLQGLGIVVEQGIVTVTVPPETQTALDVVMVLVMDGRRWWVVGTTAAGCVQEQVPLTYTMAEVGTGDTCVHEGHGAVTVTVPLTQAVLGDELGEEEGAGEGAGEGATGTTAAVVVTPPGQLEHGSVSVVVELLQAGACVVVTGMGTG